MSLVVEPEPWQAPEWYEGTALGIPAVGSLVGASTSLASGDWAGALGSGASVVGDVVDFAVDPLGTLASSAVSFLLDRFAWFQETLDFLAGDPALVTAIGLTWANVGDALETQAARLIEIRDRTVAYWHGQAADAFRQRLTEMAQRLEAEARACSAVNTGFALGSGVVTLVREIITAILAEIVGRVIAWGAEALLTLGLSTPVIVAKASKAITGWIADASKWTDELLGSAGKFTDVLQKLYRAFDELGLYDLGIGPNTVVGAGASATDQSVRTYSP